MTDGNYTLIPAVDFSIESQICVRQCVFGKFDGKNTSLAVASSSGKVHIRPLDQSLPPNSLSLGHGVEVTALTAGVISKMKGITQDLLTGLTSEELGGAAPSDTISHDVLMVGLGTSLLAYDPQRNADLFRVPCPDGVSALELVRRGGASMLVVGGDCALQGFDCTGEDVWWNVTGEYVTALQQSGENLHVASADATVRTYTGSEMRKETAFGDNVIQMKQLVFNDATMVLLLFTNGTLSLWDPASPSSSCCVWQHNQGKHTIDVCPFPAFRDDVNDVAVAYEDSIAILDASNGSIICTYTLPSPPAALLHSTVNDTDTLFAVLQSGRVLGFPPPSRSTVFDAGARGAREVIEAQQQQREEAVAANIRSKALAAQQRVASLRSQLKKAYESSDTLTAKAKARTLGLVQKMQGEVDWERFELPQLLSELGITTRQLVRGVTATVIPGVSPTLELRVGDTEGLNMGLIGATALGSVFPNGLISRFASQSEPHGIDAIGSLVLEKQWASSPPASLTSAVAHIAEEAALGLVPSAMVLPPYHLAPSPTLTIPLKLAPLLPATALSVMLLLAREAGGQLINLPKEVLLPRMPYLEPTEEPTEEGDDPTACLSALSFRLDALEGKGAMGRFLTSVSRLVTCDGQLSFPLWATDHTAGSTPLSIAVTESLVTVSGRSLTTLSNIFTVLSTEWTVSDGLTFELGSGTISDISELVKRMVVQDDERRALLSSAGEASQLAQMAFWTLEDAVSTEDFKRLPLAAEELSAANVGGIVEHRRRETNQRQLKETLKAVNGLIKAAAVIRGDSVTSGLRAAVKKRSVDLFIEVLS